MASAAQDTAPTPDADYASWSNEQLVQRVLTLEAKLRAQVTQSTPDPTPTTTPAPSTTSAQYTKKSKKPHTFDARKYATRLIALKFSYLGAHYNGFEHHVGNRTPLPTVEEELWKALVRTRLISPPSLKESGLDGGLEKLDGYKHGEVPVDWEGCEYSKCGRTDKGVSAFGQVVGVRVRSARRKKRVVTVDGEGKEVEDWEVEEYDGFDPIKHELEYIHLLNAVLPASIRVLAWCPTPPPSFDARFSCKERVYRYYFTIPAYLPIPTDTPRNKAHTASLDMGAMRAAMHYFCGSHDFRNVCKIDASKQITEFTRRISSVRICGGSDVRFPALPYNRYEEPDVGVYYFEFVGSAFLWHQVRCMVSILFLVGQRLEAPTIVRDLLDVDNCPRRPHYEMASDRPLVLWDCRFSVTAGKGVEPEDPDRGHWDRGTGEDELEWIYEGVGTQHGNREQRSRWSRSGILEGLWQTWRSAKMDEVLARELMGAITNRGLEDDPFARAERDRSARVFTGKDTATGTGKYVPLMQRAKMESVDVINARYAQRKGLEARSPRVGDGDE